MLQERPHCAIHMDGYEVTGSVQFVNPLAIGGHKMLAPDWLGIYGCIYVLTEVENLNGTSSQLAAGTTR
jgi:hypothetical protein